MPEKATETVANLSASDPQKVSYRIGGIAKVTIFTALNKLAKTPPKWKPQWSQNRSLTHSGGLPKVMSKMNT